jgi:NTP pyrophosphatase (non-canonical NTP hydrolase)
MTGDLNTITKDDVLIFAESRNSRNLMDLYQRLATKTAIYPGIGTPLGLDYSALKGAGEAGEFAEHVGKAMRDDGLIEIVGAGPEPDLYVVRFRDLTEDRKDKLIKEVGDQLWYLSAKCNELGITLSEAALINLRKLQGRTEKGTLQGSGDDR